MRIIIAMAISCSLAACATKQYPISSAYSYNVLSKMDCRELELEAAKIADTARQIEKIKKVDARSVAGFLGDFGIGNKVAKDDARDAAFSAYKNIYASAKAQSCTTVPSVRDYSGILPLFRSN